jgi:hypothetical protein
MNLCRNALRTLGASLIIGLGFFSGALAQSGNPIRIGMSLALTGAGASPSKVINTALDIWRDDINAKGGLLGRPVELVIYDDQSAPANVPNIYTKLVTVDNVSFWVDAYFEETQLASIREGDPASIKLMGYSQIVRGKVAGVARAINVPNAQPDPAGLATVNPIFTWVRLAQRVPVRIKIDQVPEGVRLVAGMTATVEVAPRGTSN